MAVLTGSPAAYAPPQAVLSIINRYRERGLPNPITLEVLTRAGVTDSLAPRTLQTLRILDLIDGDGTPSETLEGLRSAPSTEFQARMQDFVRGAYPEVFTYVNPSVDDLEQIRDAFRPYKPHGQQARMVSLFVGLLEAAGLREPAVNGAGEPVQRRPPLKRGAPLPGTRSRKASSGANGGAPPAQGTPAPPPAPLATPVVPPMPQGSTDTADAPPAVLGLLRELPKDGKTWSPGQQQRFLAAFTAVIQLLYPAEGTD
ncbi:MAG: DUF5343 domain-containing protein [Longimicrobiaceae bacterium]